MDVSFIVTLKVPVKARQMFTFSRQLKRIIETRVRASRRLEEFYKHTAGVCVRVCM